MIDYKHGILRIEKKRDAWELITDIGLFVLLCIINCHSNNYEGRNYIYYVGFFAFVAVCVICILREIVQTGFFTLPLCTIWFGLFIAFSCTSVLWAVYPELVDEQLSKMIQCFAISFCICCTYKGQHAVYRLLNVFLGSGIYSAIYIFVSTPFSSWFSGKLGASVTNQNSNYIGLFFAIVAIIAFYYASCEKKYFHYFTTALLTSVVLLTSSRKSIIALMLGMLAVSLLTSKGMKIIKIFALAGVCVAIGIALFKVEALYRTIGVRFATMVEFFQGDESADGSIYLRKNFILLAKRLFLESPFFGVGFNNFSAFATEVSKKQTYAHNNYYEILSGLGIAGFTLYYWFYAYLGIRLVRNARKGQRIATLMLTLIMVFMVFEYGMVNYYNSFVLMIISSMFVCSCVSESSFKRGKNTDSGGGVNEAKSAAG